MAAHESSVLTLYEAQEPSALGLGAKSGRVPDEQQTCWNGCSVEQSVELGLYCVKVAPEMPHLVARDAQVSPETTWTVVQSARGVSTPLRSHGPSIAAGGCSG